jgi:tRNA (cytidine56-2'-O)-methyltransferase
VADQGEIVIVVLRMGHRPQRDKRITTHVCLTARAFGADGVYLWRTDENVKKTIDDLGKIWGDNFFVECKHYQKVLNGWEGMIVHLTMYGEKIDKITEIREKSTNKDILIVVGAEKVPPEVYEAADYNISVGSQPHSEVAALAVFLDRLSGGKSLYKEFDNAVMRIVPSAKGKKIREKDLNRTDQKEQRRENGT